MTIRWFKAVSHKTASREHLPITKEYDATFDGKFYSTFYNSYKDLKIALSERKKILMRMKVISTRTRARTMLNSNEKRECSNHSIDLCATFQLATGVSFRTRQISLAYIYPILGMISRGRIMTKTIIFAQVRRTPGHFKNEAIRL